MKLGRWSLLQLNIPQQIFTVFYAIFWGTAANAQPKWKAFAWGMWPHDRPVKRRLLLSLVLLNAIPVIYYAFVMWVLSTHAWYFHTWGLREVAKVVASVIPAFATFGFYRIWTAIVQWKPGKFYGPPESRKKLGIELAEQDLDAKWVRGNLLFGFIYVVVSFAVPCLVTLLPE
jgi:hypothetical protein